MTDYRELVRRIHDEVWNPKRQPAVEDYYADDFRNHQSPPHVADRNDLRQYAIDVSTGFPDYTLTILDEIVEGDRLALRYTFCGTHTGDFAGMPPTGRRVDSTAVIICRFVDGKVAETWWHQDTLSVLQQLGVIPAPEAAPA